MCSHEPAAVGSPTSPALASLAQRISVRASESFQQAFPGKRPSRVSITRVSGEVLIAYHERRRGDPEDPFTWPALQDRMRAFVPAMDDAQAGVLVRWCERLLVPALDDQPMPFPDGLLGARAGC